MVTKILELRGKFKLEKNEDFIYSTTPEPFYSDEYVEWLEILVLEKMDDVTDLKKKIVELKDIERDKYKNAKNKRGENYAHGALLAYKKIEQIIENKRVDNIINADI